MDNIVPLLYLSILLLALATLSVFIGGQIIERKKIENNLSDLRNGPFDQAPVVGWLYQTQQNLEENNYTC